MHSQPHVNCAVDLSDMHNFIRNKPRSVFARSLNTVVKDDTKKEHRLLRGENGDDSGRAPSSSDRAPSSGILRKEEAHVLG